MKNKGKQVGLIILVTCILSLAFTRFKIPLSLKISAEQREVIPTVFVHGYKGSERSFATMLTRMDEQQWGKKTMTIKVSEYGRITVSGRIPNHIENPFIQVIFANNRAFLNDQTKWLQDVMRMLKETYAVQKVNLVGHSMGGLALTHYVQSTASNAQYPLPVKLVTIGSPFKGIDREDYFHTNYGDALTDLRPDSNVLRQLVDNRHQFPADLQMLSIAGVIGAGANGDGLVSATSALASAMIAGSGQFKEITFTDAGATHFGLHEHPKVDEMVADFLFTPHTP